MICTVKAIKKTVSASTCFFGSWIDCPQFLQTLLFYDTTVTDAGLVHIKRLTSLKTLQLLNTIVTDAGLIHLKALAGMQTLWTCRHRLENVATGGRKT
jgi:hypothetical protein